MTADMSRRPSWTGRDGELPTSTKPSVATVPAVVTPSRHSLDVPRPSTPDLHKVPSYSSDSPRPSTSSAPTTPSSALATSTRQPDRIIDRTALSLVLLFNGPAGPSIHNTEDTAPPAFFPLQRISFSPRLRITNKAGLALASLEPSQATHDREQVVSMVLGVTGLVETLSHGRVKARRIIADYVTDLTSGLNIWRRDADVVVARKRAKQGLPQRESQADGSTILPAGTYVLPLSMRIPTSDKLPASFESPHFRLRYTMSLALLCRPANAPDTQRLRIVKVASHPFSILPSTLPSPAPDLPILTYEERKVASSSSGLIAGLCRSLSLPGSLAAAPAAAASPATELAMPITPAAHVVTPSLPTSHFSPGSVIPLTLRVLSTPLSRQSDLYVRLALIRKIYVRDASHAPEADNEWGMPDEMVWEQWRVSEDVVCSRWGYVPCEARIGGDGATEPQGNEQAEVILRDIALPIGYGRTGWTHGYSTAIDLPPSARPSLATSTTGSWFSPTVQSVIAGNAKDADRHLHVSTRFFLAVEVGFHTATAAAPTRLADIFAARAEELGRVPKPSTFTRPAYPGVNPFPGDGASSSSPYLGVGGTKNGMAQWERSAASNGSSFFGRSSSSSSSSHLFPGTVRELLIPVTIGSVAEPTMRCVAGRRNMTTGPASPRSTAAAAREEIMETPAERQERIGEDGEEAWLVPPPSFEESLKAAPAYI